MTPRIPLEVADEPERIVPTFTPRFHDGLLGGDRQSRLRPFHQPRLRRSALTTPEPRHADRPLPARRHGRADFVHADRRARSRLLRDRAPGAEGAGQRRQRRARPRQPRPGTSSGFTRRRPRCTSLYQDGRVAFVHAAGLDTYSRSHFDNQAQIELGTPGVGGTTDGWLTRHFLTAPDLPPATPMVQRDRGLVAPSRPPGSPTPTSSPSPTATTSCSTPAPPPGATRRRARCATSSICTAASIRATPRPRSRSTPRASSSRTCPPSPPTCRRTAPSIRPARSATR